MPEFCEPLGPIRQSKFGKLGNNLLFRKKGPRAVTYGLTVTNSTNYALSWTVYVKLRRDVVVSEGSVMYPNEAQSTSRVVKVVWKLTFLILCDVHSLYSYI